MYILCNVSRYWLILIVSLATSLVGLINKVERWHWFGLLTSLRSQPDLSLIVSNGNGNLWRFVHLEFSSHSIPMTNNTRPICWLKKWPPSAQVFIAKSVEICDWNWPPSGPSVVLLSTFVPSSKNPLPRVSFQESSSENLDSRLSRSEAQNEITTANIHSTPILSKSLVYLVTVRGCLFRRAALCWRRNCSRS